MKPSPAQVRWLARAAAVTLCAALLLLAGLVSRTEVGPSAPGTAIVAAYVTSEAAPPQPRPQPRTRASAPAPSPRATIEGDALSVWLWRTSAQGEIVFEHAEQYQRCRAARRAGREEADCPSSDETRPLILADASR